ncbi:MAG: polysaccharide deacetylase family protein [Xanthomonadales bacterium]|nr:polysaccharide deacetylase family protein [Xanthomonadales bacterium]
MVDRAPSMPLPARRHWRPVALLAVLVAHVLAPVLWLAGAGGDWAFATLLAGGALLVWGSLYPHSRLFGPVLTRLATDRPLVWLTFDDGPCADTPALLDLLDRHRARATFFLVGARARRHPGLVREIVRRGHEVANHTDSHPAGRFWLLGPRALAEEIDGAQATLATLAGTQPRWFRAVAGLGNPFLSPALHRAGLTRVSWTARGFDGIDGNDDRVLARVLRRLRPGAILLVHEGGAPGRSTVLAGRLLAALAARGYAVASPETATTSQLLKGVRPHSGAKCADRPSAASSDARPARVG